MSMEQKIDHRVYSLEKPSRLHDHGRLLMKREARTEIDPWSRVLIDRRS